MTPDQIERQQERDRQKKQQARYLPWADDPRNPASSANASRYNWVEEQPLEGGDGGAGRQRQAEQQLLDLRSKYMQNLRSTNEQARLARVAGAERAERLGSRQAASGMGGALPATRMQNLLNVYRGQEAGLLGRAAGEQQDLVSGIASVRNLLDKGRYEDALKRAAAVAQWWQNTLQKNLTVSPETQAFIQQTIGGGK